MKFPFYSYRSLASKLTCRAQPHCSKASCTDEYSIFLKSGMFFSSVCQTVEQMNISVMARLSQGSDPVPPISMKQCECYNVVEFLASPNQEILQESVSPLTSYELQSLASYSLSQHLNFLKMGTTLSFTNMQKNMHKWYQQTPLVVVHIQCLVWFFITTGKYFLCFYSSLYIFTKCQ